MQSHSMQWRTCSKFGMTVEKGSIPPNAIKKSITISTPSYFFRRFFLEASDSKSAKEKLPTVLEFAISNPL